MPEARLCARRTIDGNPGSKKNCCEIIAYAKLCTQVTWYIIYGLLSQSRKLLANAGISLRYFFASIENTQLKILVEICQFFDRTERDWDVQVCSCASVASVQQGRHARFFVDFLYKSTPQYALNLQNLY